MCAKQVTSRQQCDRCRRWINRLCGTGMTQNEYLEVMRRIKRKEEFSWWCKGCSEEKQGLSDLVGRVCESTRADVDSDSDLPNVGLLANVPVASGLQ